MSHWKSVKAKQLMGLAADRVEVAWQSGSHRRLKRPGWPNYTFAFHDSDEVGPALVAQIAKKTGLQPGDL
jgi:predicted RNA binding protein YcfA (HicA-like mRNA interferase family)